MKKKNKKREENKSGIFHKNAHFVHNRLAPAAVIYTGH